MKSYMNPEFYMSSMKNIHSVDLASITNTMQRAMRIFF
ncbi:phasin family protein [Rickettsia rhipicephali str. Ect]|uniref:Phasin family protein n=1 Tax=Rickettsia rhipicephali str. Ect TaxID=1359199 RepID=A0A0F3PEI6_RICRH|nr:phasin family protein [Rickettsia rhipicephali str. Ect]